MQNQSHEILLHRIKTISQKKQYVLRITDYCLMNLRNFKWESI